MKPARAIASISNVVLACVLSAGQASAAGQDRPPAAEAAAASSATANDSANEKLMVEGIAVHRAGQPQRAIDDYFDKVIAVNDKYFASLGQTVYAARNPIEALAYMAKHATDPASKTNAVAVSSSAAYAHYMKAFALVDLKREAEARGELDKALALSPENALFHDELGSWYARRGDWEHALQSYQHAERSVSLGPPESKNRDLGAAWRGMGYVYIEQHKLDEAEAMYRKCLDMDGKDKKALNEIEYIRQQRAKAG